MRPRERRESGEQDLFRSRLDQVINMDHALVKLARTIDWAFLEQRFGAVYEDKPGRRIQEVETYSTMTRSLLAMSDRLRCLGVTRVVMEATSDYWKPIFYVLEAQGFETWLVNARDVKHLPGRPKTDTLDAVWLCKVAERQMIRPSFVPPPQIRRLRDVTRYRIDLVGTRTAEKNRAEKLLEDAGIKLSVVASDIFGVSGRAM